MKSRMQPASAILFICLLLPQAGLAQTGRACPRFEAGSTIVEPVDLFSSRGVLELNLTYRTRVDQYGNTLYCFTTSAGAESPTLHVYPGDQLIINLTNELPASLGSSSARAIGFDPPRSPRETSASYDMNVTTQEKLTDVLFSNAGVP